MPKCASGEKVPCSTVDEFCPTNAQISYQDARGTHEAGKDPPIPTIDAPDGPNALVRAQMRKLRNRGRLEIGHGKSPGTPPPPPRNE